jgi:hypothetical protein
MEGEAMNTERPRDVVEGSGRRGETRRLDQMISARLDPALVAKLKRLAADRGVSLSDILREAALLLIERDQASEIGSVKNLTRFSVQVTNGQSGPAANQKFDREIPASV